MISLPHRRLAACYTCFALLACSAFVRIAIADENRLANYYERLPDLDAGFEMVGILGGEVTLRAMDVDTDDPAKILTSDKEYRVKISPFWLAKFELTGGAAKYWYFPPKIVYDRFDQFSQKTQTAYRACPGEWGIWVHPPEDDEPLVSLSQFGAKKFCHWLSLMTGKFYRLPTEAEWEYACRAGSKERYSWGNAPGYKEFLEKSEEIIPLTDPYWDGYRVGRLDANPWGLYDMEGGVLEWVADGFHPGYEAFAGREELVDPVAWPVGHLERQEEPFEIPVNSTELPDMDRKYGLRLLMIRTDNKEMSAEFVRLLRERLTRQGMICSKQSPVARGGCSWSAVSPTDDHFSCAARYRPAASVATSNIESMFYNSIYWNEGRNPYAMGFRLARPVKVPSREVQLLHWGIYENHEFWLAYTLAPSE